MTGSRHEANAPSASAVTSDEPTPRGRTVGIIGIGAMGRGFAKNLLTSGFRVQGYDREGGRLDELEREGGVRTGSPAEAARGASWLLTSLPAHADVSEVALGEGGVVEGAESGLIFVDTSTSLPEQSRSLAKDLVPSGIRFLDASISGTGKTVLTKDVVVLAGGEGADFAESLPLFEAIGRRAYHLGPVGSGALGKLAINVAVVGNRLALAEALTFGISAGMDPTTLLEILKDGASYSKAMDLKGEKMIGRDYAPESTLSASVHGCDLLLEQGQHVGAPMFLTSLYAQIAQIGLRIGYSDADPAALIEVLLSLSAKAERSRHRE